MFSNMFVQFVKYLLNAILYLCGKCFETSDMQFGFKTHHSTVLCNPRSVLIVSLMVALFIVAF